MNRYSKLPLLLLSTLSLFLPGCLKARETDRVLYDPARDEFRLVMVLERIDASISDLEYLGAITQNKDHLIAPVMPGNAFGYAPWFLRLADHKTAKVSFIEPRKGDMNPIDAAADLSAISIRPGAFFVQDNTLCYYHAITMPGKTVDAIIAQTRKDQLDPLKKEIKKEIERRRDKGRIYTWPELMEQEIKALKEGSTEHPIKPFMVIEEASLDKLAKMQADVKQGVTRDGAKFTLMLPLTARDRDGFVQLWAAWMKAADATADQKKDNPMLALQRIPAKSVTVTPNADGVLLALDVVKVYNDFAQAFLAYADSQSSFKPPADPRPEVLYAQKHNWPIESNITTPQILKDFDANTLKSFPSATPVVPGTGLKVQPKKD
jgi:hypothetical protein